MKGGIRRGEGRCVVIDGRTGWEEDFTGLYILLPLPLASLVS